MAVFDHFWQKSPSFELKTTRKMHKTISNVFYRSLAIVEAIEHHFLMTLGFESFQHKIAPKYAQIFVKSSHVLTCFKFVRTPCFMVRSKAESLYFSNKIEFWTLMTIFESIYHDLVHWSLEICILSFQMVTHHGVVRKACSMLQRTLESCRKRWK